MAELMEADALVKELRSNGFTLRIKDGKLLATPLSKLSQQYRQAISRTREEIIALLEWEAIESPATDDTLKAWWKTMAGAEKSAKQLSQAAPRRIILLAADGVSVDRVLAELPAAGIIEELRRLRAEHPGRSLAAEWMQEKKWIRWITTTGGQP